jgi:hypothetical protein
VAAALAKLVARMATAKAGTGYPVQFLALLSPMQAAVLATPDL